jgi:uncharacterized protein involved in outer membrane biogenesis
MSFTPRLPQSPPPHRPWWRRWRIAATATLALFACALVLGEWQGWPILAGPLARAASARLGRPVTLEAGSDGSTHFAVRFIGGLRLQAARLRIAAPAWSAEPHMLLADDVELELRYVDLWRAWRGQRLRLARVQARALDASAERLADGRASWQFGASGPPLPADAPPQLPALDALQIGGGVLRWRDAPLAIDVQAQLARVDTAAPGFKLGAFGRYQHQPVRVGFAAVPDAAPGTGMALALNATVGRAALQFQGRSSEHLSLAGLSGRYAIAGPSLAAVGRPVGLTLPTTGAFRARGSVMQQGALWQTTVDEATVGASTLSGDFAFDAAAAVPRLTGQLRGKRLLLVDLGPVVGTTPAGAGAPAAAPVRHPHRVLPNRPFDLAALRAMDADVAIAIDEVDLNTRFLEPLRPLQARLQLSGGVLGLNDIDTRTGTGRLGGNLGLDGRGAQALWSADLLWADVQLEHWVQQKRAPGLPPYVAGRLAGRASLKGHGLSTGEILGTLEGELRSELRDGALSHLGVVAAGLDVAGGVGTLLRGDDALPVSCGVADMVASAGVLRPRLVLLETSVSAIWVDGTISLATEALDLSVRVSPKDFSLLSLRSPLHVGGSFAQPEVSLASAVLARKLGSAVLLGLVNPLAALAPLIDTGDRDAAARGAAGCRALAQRHAAALRALPALAALSAAPAPGAAASAPAPRR